jgi:5-methylcytosine-specific restriction endonuclease McrA
VNSSIKPPHKKEVQSMPAIPKPDHNRRTPKRKNLTNFDQKTIREIAERDEHQCVRCGSYQLDPVPHHVQYRSSMGTGSKRNGVSICRRCHDWAHSNKKQHNIWFARWVELNLDEEGNRLHEVPIIPR